MTYLNGTTQRDGTAIPDPPDDGLTIQVRVRERALDNGAKYEWRVINTSRPKWWIFPVKHLCSWSFERTVEEAISAARRSLAEIRRASRQATGRQRPFTGWVDIK